MAKQDQGKDLRDLRDGRDAVGVGCQLDSSRDLDGDRPATGPITDRACEDACAMSCYRCPVCLVEFPTREAWETHKMERPDHAAEAGVDQILAGWGFRRCGRCSVAIVGKGVCVKGQHIHEDCATPDERLAWESTDPDVRDILTGNTDPRLVGLPVIRGRRMHRDGATSATGKTETVGATGGSPIICQEPKALSGVERPAERGPKALSEVERVRA